MNERLFSKTQLVNLALALEVHFIFGMALIGFGGRVVNMFKPAGPFYVFAASQLASIRRWYHHLLLSGSDQHAGTSRRVIHQGCLTLVCAVVRFAWPEANKGFPPIPHLP